MSAEGVDRVDRDKIELDLGRCMACGECLDVCPRSSDTDYPVFRRTEMGMPELLYPESCISCMECAVRCRAMALRVEGLYLPPFNLKDPQITRKIYSLY